MMRGRLPHSILSAAASSRRIVGAHERYSKFADYGDAASYHKELEALRSELNQQRAAGS
jgi:hypothetical protein